MAQTELFPSEMSFLKILAEDCKRAVGSVLIDMRVLPDSVQRGRGELHCRIQVTMKEEDERAVSTISGMFEESLVEKDLFCNLDFHTGVQAAGMSLLHE